MEKKSRVTDYTEYCLFDERPATEFHHLIFGNGRSRSEQDGLVIPAAVNAIQCPLKSESAYMTIHGQRTFPKCSGRLYGNETTVQRAILSKKPGRPFAPGIKGCITNEIYNSRGILRR